MYDITASWLSRFPHKINIDDHPVIHGNIRKLQNEFAGPSPGWTKPTMADFRRWYDRKINWLFDYADEQGQDAFLEVDKTGNWFVFPSDDGEEELTLFILRHS
jgi:hypothetical protein